MSITKKMRFEVFKRDSFTCQYCGKSAPDVVLNADHIDPKANGGTDDIMNLITSCFDCNQGKKDRTLNDTTVIQKRKRQLDELQTRREQLEMLMEWQQGLSSLNDETLEAMHSLWRQLAKGYRLGESGLTILAKWIKKYDLIELADAMRISTDQYLIYPKVQEGDTKATAESVEKAFDYVPRIISNKKKMEAKPYLKELYYVRGILKRRLSYVNDWKSLDLLETAYLAGATVEELTEVAKTVRNWTIFVATMSSLINQEDAE